MNFNLSIFDDPSAFFPLDAGDYWCVVHLPTDGTYAVIPVYVYWGD